MKTVLIFGTSIVNLALISYSVAIITEQLRHKLSKRVLSFLTTGLVLDITATVLMIIGSENSPFSLHGMLGYSSLSGMLIDGILMWKLKIRSGSQSAVPRGLHLYSRIAYIWWIMAYLTGAMIVFMK